MMTINGEEIASSEVEFGTRYIIGDNTYEQPAETEQEARELAGMTGGQLLVRRLYFSAWETEEL